MNLFKAPHNIHLIGSLERRQYLQQPQQTSKITISNSELNTHDILLNLSISMSITPFQEIFLGQTQNAFSARLTFPNTGILLLKAYYQNQKKLKITSIFTKNKKQCTKESQQTLQILHQNKVIYNFYYQNEVIPPGKIHTVIQFQQYNPYFKGIIGNFSVDFNLNLQTKSVSIIQQTSKWISKIDTISHPISLKESTKLQLNVKSNKSPHKIPLLKKGRKLLICHDMQNGYKQDINEFSNRNGKHAYRFNHWKITDIFIYFSHQNIAIPPKHYRILCKRQKVVCLATFIIQTKIDWLKFEMADYLIFLVRQYQFDGYLINIEYPVSDAALFKDWLKYLTQNIHNQLPNSIVVLYDAIVEDGSLKWQSGLSDKNIDFITHVDYFFTDYHWNLEHLETTAALSESVERGTDIFVGNDVFGRGTYGGGIFNTHLAIKQIDKFNLSTAIFAPGYVYENEGGRKNYQRFQQLDDKLWFGKQSVEVHLNYDNWHYQTSTWKQEGIDAVTSALDCVRVYKHPLPANNSYYSVMLSVYIKGTPPNCKDPYKISIQLVDAYDAVIKSAKTGNNYRYATENYEQIKLKLSVNQAERAKAKYLRVVQVGRDAENWGGNYGVRFKQEVLYFAYRNKQRSLSSYFQQKPEQFPYQSFYNSGVGPNYFFQGQKIRSSGYCFLPDYDIPYQNKSLLAQDAFDGLHSSSQVVTDYDQSIGWIGAGSIRIVSTNSRFGIRLVKLEAELQLLKIRIMVQVNNQKLPSIGLKFKKGETYTRDVISKAKGNWKQLSANIEFQDKKELQSVYLLYDGQNQNKQIQINLGQISVYGPTITTSNPIKPQILSVRPSIISIDHIDLYVELAEFPASKTIFVQVNHKVIGTMYSSSTYFQQIPCSCSDVKVTLFELLYDGVTHLIHEQTFKLEL